MVNHLNVAETVTAQTLYLRSGVAPIPEETLAATAREELIAELQMKGTQYGVDGWATSSEFAASCIDHERELTAREEVEYNYHLRKGAEELIELIRDGAIGS